MFGSVEAMLSASADKPLWRAVLEDDCQDRDADPAASLARCRQTRAARTAQPARLTSITTVCTMDSRSSCTLGDWENWTIRQPLYPTWPQAT